MNRRACIGIGFFLATLAGFLFYCSLTPHVIDHLWPDAADFLKSASSFVLQGAVAFSALAIFAQDKVRAEQLARAEIELKVSALREIRERIPRAQKAVGALQRIQAEANCELAADGVEPFSSIAAFCSAWKKPEREMACNDALRDLLRIANERLFAFVVSLELKKDSAAKNLKSLGDEASASLKNADIEIRKQLGWSG